MDLLSKSYWFVGASYGGTEDQTDRFLKDGVWQNGYTDKYLDVVRAMQPGDRIAIKSSYTRKRELPFDNKDQTVSVMGIKAIGTVVKNHGDGRLVDVEWGPRLDPVHEWYFYTNRSTVWRVLPGDWLVDGLIDFTFNNGQQDIDRFRNAPYWRERFGNTPIDKQRFQWTSFYEAIADKLLGFKNKRSDLIEFAIHIAEEYDLSYIKDKRLDDICPFTVMGMFNRGVTIENRKAIAKKLADFLGVEKSVPDSFEGIPILNNQKSWFFGFEDKREITDIDSLWDFLEVALHFADTDEADARQNFGVAYDQVTKQYGVGWNLSMALYWIRPWIFLTLDGQSQLYITKKLGIEINKSGSKHRCSSKDYLKVLDELESRFQEEGYPVHSFPELSLAAWQFGGAILTIDEDFSEDSEIEDLAIEDAGLEPKELIPKFDSLMIPFLQHIKDGKTYPAKDVYNAIKSNLVLDKYDVITLPSTGQPLFDNRIAWAKSYLKRAGLVDFPKRAHVIITKKGSEFIRQPASTLNNYQTFTDFFSGAEEVVREAPITPYLLDDIINDGCFIDRETLEGILERLRTKKNIILQGPPGTGKTWLAKRLAFALMGQKNDGKLKTVQFHPNLTYEDFIRGWRPTGDGKLTLVDGPFIEMITAAQKDASTKHVVVIEEINRGNPAQIFGEMLTLLEADKRTPTEALELSYRRTNSETVFIPDNLYVIGTMNIADRSLALVDIALRRRFAFIDLQPTFGEQWRNWVHNKAGITMDVLELIEQRLLILNAEIENDRNLGAKFKIGHSYVTPAFSNTIKNATQWYKSVVRTEIGPLLKEYWFDDLERATKAENALIVGM